MHKYLKKYSKIQIKMAINKYRYNCKAELNDIFTINIDDCIIMYYYIFSILCYYKQTYPDKIYTLIIKIKSTNH